MYRPSPPIACTPAVVLWTARPPRTSQLYRLQPSSSPAIMPPSKPAFVMTLSMLFAHVTCSVLSMTMTFSNVVFTALPAMMPPRKSAQISASLTRKFLMVAPLVSAKKPVSRSGSRTLLAYFKPVTVWFWPSKVPRNGKSLLPNDRCFTVLLTMSCMSLSPS